MVWTFVKIWKFIVRQSPYHYLLRFLQIIKRIVDKRCLNISFLLWNLVVHLGRILRRHLVELSKYEHRVQQGVRA